MLALLLFAMALPAKVAAHCVRGRSQEIFGMVNGTKTRPNEAGLWRDFGGARYLGITLRK
jgi:hypothetical protein